MKTEPVGLYCHDKRYDGTGTREHTVSRQRNDDSATSCIGRSQPGHLLFVDTSEHPSGSRKSLTSSRPLLRS
ncbi:hypothetical protein NDU88_000756 [Pleurodeles waltl]|uniref:Uncharacterized protein n=1 Tax=Pleurodeles waltl TaxID=8319 RepID=A0AAV7S6Z4_PLEWA|nr:hypothetical protein NDU88_000756 [Pleurodeles waltl]